MKTLIMADLHLDDNPLHEYRWKIFPWLREIIVENGIEKLVILGDLTDKKDNHSAKLVNRLIDCLEDLLVSYFEIEILKGNHDYVNEPFFNFLTKINKIRFRSVSTSTSNKPVVYIPYGDIMIFDNKVSKVIYCHHDFVGATYENGYPCEKGYGQSPFNKFKGRVFSGHVHVPQKVGKVEYVGSPYPITFQEKEHDRHCIIYDDKKDSVTYVHFETIRRSKYTVRVNFIGSKVYNEGDQVKFEVQLYQSEIFQYPEIKKDIRKYCEDNGLVLCGIKLKKLQSSRPRKNKKISMIKSKDNVSVLNHYSKREELSERHLTTALELING